MIEFDPVLVHEWLSRSATRTPDKVALVCGDRRWTYRQLDDCSSLLARHLLERGLRRHDRVAILLDNSAETVIAIYGTLKAGAAFVNLSSSIKGRKLAYILKNSGASCLITHVAKAQVARDALERIEQPLRMIWVGDQERLPSASNGVSTSWDDIFDVEEDAMRAALSSLVLPRVIDVDLATLIYTSGSTGEPKGVMTTHQNMVSAARSIIQYIDNRRDDVILNVLPLSFDYGLYQVIMAFMFGATVVLEQSFLYLHAILQRIGEEKVTGFPIVPTIAAMLLRLRTIETYDLNSLRYVTNTGAALPVEHIRQLRKLLPHVTLISMFGLTECKRVSFLPPHRLDDKPSSVGMAMPNCEVFVVDEQGEPVPPGQPGELVVRGANVMQGYWDDPELTTRTYRPGRYPAERRLYSGDLFRCDEEGHLYFLGRRDDMIKTKGERVSAREVENCLHAMDQVSEIAVLGVPDEIFGQAIKACVVPIQGSELTKQEVLRYAAENLESFMVPKYVVILDELPRSGNGKIDRRKLQTVEEEAAC
ncbi:MAG: AMP-binding protein [Sedimentisphaerales bacterium]|nr:AMP-binding protein [Sedimentisphaerales bacterium]